MRNEPNASPTPTVAADAAAQPDERTAFEEIRAALDETYKFASTSPRARDNINFIYEKLDEIEARAASTQPSEKLTPDEPRNVHGMTRSEFEHYLRVGYQHDNVRAQERGLGPKWPNGQIGLTPQDEREIAERVERNYPTLGTFACPICGKDAPHEHSAEDIVAHRNEQKARAASKGGDQQ